MERSHGSTPLRAGCDPRLPRELEDLNVPGPAVLAAAVPRPSLPLGELEIVLLALGALALTGFFAILRGALMHSVPSRVLEGAAEGERARLQPLLERAESLATSASVFEIAFQLLFALLLVDVVGGEDGGWSSIGLALAFGVPLLVFASDLLPTALRGDLSDGLLRTILPAFELGQRPLGALIVGLEAARRALMRLLRVPERPSAARRIVEVLREVVEDSEREGDLVASEREIIENVVEFYDVDVAEVMTPRTELSAVDVADGLPEIVRTIAEKHHSRIPVFEGNLDTVIGVVHAKEILQLLSRGELETADVRALLRPVSFVPETKLVSELLDEFRAGKQKLVIVLDEYGGTAGLATMGDILEEIVGEMHDELGDAPTEAIRRRDDGLVDVEAGTRISEVNEELELELPEEEDYETLGGFVLARLGHFPKSGESFRWAECEFLVTEANDRRVLSVRLRLPETQKAG